LDARAGRARPEHAGRSSLPGVAGGVSLIEHPAVLVGLGSVLAFLFGLAAAWLWRRVDERNGLAKLVTELRGDLIEFRAELRAVKQDVDELKVEQKELRAEL